MVNQNGKTPLDYEEQAVDTTSKKGKKSLAYLLEMIPIILLFIGVFLKKAGNEYWFEFLFAGGGLAALIYLLFSWYLFKVNEYRLIEVLASILTGLFFFLAFIGLYFKIASWTGGALLLNIGIYGGLGLFAISAFMYLFYLSDQRASRFYQNLLARLLVFVTILLSLLSIF